MNSTAFAVSDEPNYLAPMVLKAPFHFRELPGALLLVAALAAFTPACGATTSTNGDSSGTTSGGQVSPPSLAPGKACTANTDCDSGVCGVNGTGSCCAIACATTDAACGATSCDTNGTCVYPQPGSSCPGACVGQAVTTNACNGNGVCKAISSIACANDYVCADGGAGCLTACTSAADCSSGFGCNAGVCIHPIATGACTENDDCTSGICGVNGSGNCCRNPCNSLTAPCGATACDADTGTCLYPSPSTACGSIVLSCTDGVQQNPSLCDGDGGCNPHPSTVNCDPFLCGPSACYTSCTDDSRCEAGLFCDSDGSSCCPDLLAGQKLAVDALNGDDTAACCGLQGNPPCRTLAHILHLVDESGVEGLTIEATIGKVGGTWAPANEVYPIVLGWGVTLNASGIFFTDPASPPSSAIIDVRHYSARDTAGKASLIGSAGAVHVGNDASGVASAAPVAIAVEPGNALYLASVAINSNSNNKTTALRVNAGARLLIGADQSGFVHGPVVIGRSNGDGGIDGYDGIVCGSDTDAGTGCTISDVTVAGGSLIIQGQSDVDLDAEDFANVTLTGSPSIGETPSAGFGGCGIKADVGASNGAAVLLHGKATMLYSGTVQCIAGKGFDLQPSSVGTPTLTLSMATVQNTELAVHASAGTATVSNSTIQYNYNGVVEDSDGVDAVTIDLSGGKLGGTNTVICASSLESVFDAGAGGPGACLRNDTTQNLNASNVAWDTSRPDVFTCDPTLTNCSCDISTCTADAGSDDMDVVLVREDAGVGSVTTTGNTLSPTTCVTPPLVCGQEICSPGEICCNFFEEQFCEFPGNCP